MVLRHQLVLLILTAFFWGNTTVLAQAPETKHSYPELPPEPGEVCLVCGVQLDAGDVALLLRGRRVPLKRAMVDSFLADQERFFARLQPRGALFQENLPAGAVTGQGGVTSVWFAAGLYVLSMLLLAGLSGYVAVTKGNPPVKSFFLGLLLHVPGFLYVLTRPASVARVAAGLGRVPVTAAPQKCTECGAANHPTAAKCLNCGTVLQPRYESDVRRMSKRN